MYRCIVKLKNSYEKTKINRTNVNVSSDRTASPHSRLLWHDSILKSSTTDLGA